MPRYRKLVSPRLPPVRFTLKPEYGATKNTCLDARRYGFLSLVRLLLFETDHVHKIKASILLFKAVSKAAIKDLLQNVPCL